MMMRTITKLLLSAALLALFTSGCYSAFAPGGSTSQPAATMAAPTAMSVQPSAAPTAAPTLAPTQTTSPEARFSYEGISLIQDPALLSSATGQTLPENPGSNDGPYWEVHPQYRSLAIAGYPLSNTEQQPVIAVYPVEDFRRLDENAGKIIDSLKALLAQQPADADKLPFLPIWNAGQVFHANVKYLNFAGGSGVRYLTLYAQYPAPINNHDLFYTFQGLTSDGRYYISVILPINQAALVASPNALTQAEMEAITKDAGYYATQSAALSAADPTSFTPGLDGLDAWMQSIEISK
jgi:hypothetical protein